MSKHRKSISVDSVVSFDFRNLVAKIKKEIKVKYQNILPIEFFRRLIYKELKNFILNNQTFEYICKPTNFNGMRWFVKCPSCKRPCSKLYLPDKYKDKEQRYLCTKCHNIIHVSTYAGNTKLYKTVIKPLKKLETLKNRLKKMGNKKHYKSSIKYKKYFDLLEEFNKLQKEIEESPSYRLWKFSKEYSKPKPGRKII